LKAYAYILRLTSAQLRYLVVYDWAARAVLRYWRLQRKSRQVVERLRIRRRQLSITLVGHGLVLGLGLVLVVPVLTQRPVEARAATAQFADYLWTSPARPRNAPVRELLKASVLEELPAPEVMLPAAAPAAAARAAGPFTPPPPGSGGDGLAAIYAVFANSPGLTWALRVANCESNYNPLAVNRSSGASGLFQFMPSTWNANFPGQNIWDPYAQARGALVFYNAGRQSAWTCK